MHLDYPQAFLSLVASSRRGVPNHCGHGHTGTPTAAVADSSARRSQPMGQYTMTTRAGYVALSKLDIVATPIPGEAPIAKYLGAGRALLLVDVCEEPLPSHTTTDRIDDRRNAHHHTSRDYIIQRRRFDVAVRNTKYTMLSLWLQEPEPEDARAYGIFRRPHARQLGAWLPTAPLRGGDQIPRRCHRPLPCAVILVHFRTRDEDPSPA
jgi:hypothetical protein